MVDKDIGQNLEVNIRKRKEFILRDDLDNLQKDFIEKKEKCWFHDLVCFGYYLLFLRLFPIAKL